MGFKFSRIARGYIQDIESSLSDLIPKTKEELFRAIVDAPFKDKAKVIQFDLGITVLLLKNNESRMVDRVALSRTKMARGAVRMSAKAFKDIKIPFSNQKNIINKAIGTGEIQHTSDWHDLFVPDLTAQQARFNQSGAGIECSMVSKLNVKDGGAMIFSFYQPYENLESRHHGFVRRYSEIAEKTLNRLIDKF